MENTDDAMQKYLKALHTTTISLARTETLDDFYYCAVEQGLTQLGFDRVGLLLYDPLDDSAVGTYGTDGDGKLVDEHHLRLDPAGLTGILRRTLDRNERFAFDEHAQLFANFEPIGAGQNAVAALWNGEVLGWLAIDNGVHHQPITRVNLEILALYALTTGALLARKRAEFTLSENESRYRMLAESIRDVIVKLSPEGIIKFVTPSCYDVLGYEPEDILGQSGFDVVHPEDVAHSYAVVSQSLAAKAPFFSLIERVRRKTGEYIWMEILNTTVYDPQTGEPVEMVGVFRDITLQKQTEESLKQALKHEQELSELKSRFLSIASHEFRNPLATISAATDTLLMYRNKMDNQQIDSRLSKILNQVKNMKHILDEVLQLARMQAGRVEFKPIRDDLHQFVQNVIEEFEVNPLHHGRIVCQVETAPLVTIYDERLMHEIVNNLICNALKYSPGQKPIYVTLSHELNEVNLRVKDEGIGIPPDDLKRLFEPFHRAANVGMIQGTGLGLSITKQAVELHGGTISVESQIGQGTTFTVRLPHNHTNQN